MKRIFCALSCVMLMLVGMPAWAQDIVEPEIEEFDLTVIANPDHIASVVGGSYSRVIGSSSSEGSLHTLQFSASGTSNHVVFEGSNFYVKVTPKANVKYTATLRKADGTAVATFMMYNKTAAAVAGVNVALFKGATLEIVSESTQQSTVTDITVNVIGDPAKVMMSMGGVDVTSLKAGENKIRLNNSVVVFRSKKGNPFYKLVHFYDRFPDGAEVEPSTSYVGDDDIFVGSETPEGGTQDGVYNYTFTGVVAGERFDIYTDYPEMECNITISVSGAVDIHDFIKSVTVDGEAVNNWANGFVTGGGVEVLVSGDRWTYAVKSSSINGVETGTPTASLESIIKGDTEFHFEVEKIERNDYIDIYVPADHEAVLQSSNGCQLDLAIGHNVVAFGDEEFTLNFSNTVSKSENLTGYVYINEALKKSDVRSYTWVPMPRQVVKVYHDENAPTSYTVSYVIDKAVGNDPVIVKDYVAPAGPASHSVHAGTVITLQPAPGCSFSKVLANDVAVAEDADGKYTVKVNANTTIKVKQMQTGIDAIEADDAAKTVYNLQGVRVANPKGGIFIVDGKKVVIR